jgi:hypothetical protein
MSEHRVSTEIIEYVAAVAKAIREVKAGDVLSIYVTEVRFGCEGEDIDVRLRPDDFEGYDVVTGAPEPATERTEP